MFCLLCVYPVTSYNLRRFNVLGPDLATAHFIVAHGGAVRFVDGDTWVRMPKGTKVAPLPGVRNRHMKLEAVDASKTTIMYRSLDNFSKGVYWYRSFSTPKVTFH